VSFRTLASLLLPLENERRGAILETDDRWSFYPGELDAEVVLWGRPPMPSGMSLATLSKAALAREWTLQQLRRHAGRWRTLSVHRLPPPALGLNQRRERLRSTMLAGALVELAAGEPAMRVVDGAAVAAGAEGPVDAFSAGSGGSIISRLSLRNRSSAVLRVGKTDTASDPSPGGEALTWLAESGIPAVPRPLASGQLGDVGWTLESQMEGTRAGLLSDGLLFDVARFCARLPATSAPPTAFVDDLEDIARAFPAHASQLRTVTALIRPVLRCLPAVTRHGDLWSGNILIDRAGLTGVIDWDAWHPRGVPGTDLLHLLGMNEAIRSGRELGSVWRDSPWRSAQFQSISAEYWAALDVWPNAATLQSVAIAWWAGYVAHTIDCDPTRTQDSRWTKLNVHDVLRALERVIL
jgi:hypothetical protein